MSEASAWSMIEEWNKECDALRQLEADAGKRKELVARFDTAAKKFAQFPQAGVLKARHAVSKVAVPETRALRLRAASSTSRVLPFARSELLDRNHVRHVGLHDLTGRSA